MSNLGELVREKVMENSAEKIAVKALAVAFIATILERHSDQLTQEEIDHATQVAYAACNTMQDDGVQSTAYDLFMQAVKMLEE